MQFEHHQDVWVKCPETVYAKYESSVDILLDTDFLLPDDFVMSGLAKAPEPGTLQKANVYREHADGRILVGIQFTNHENKLLECFALVEASDIQPRA